MAAADAQVKHRPIAPIARAKRRVRRQRSRRSLLLRLAALLGLRRTIAVERVRYRERSAESLRRALAPAGRGYKEYSVRFPAGRRMRIRATRARHYDDIAGPARTALYRDLADLVTPGMRVLDCHCGTGGGTHTLAHLVGPSGAVVATCADGESVRFARRRYPHPNVAFEIAPPVPVPGEVDHAFDAVVAVDALALDERAPDHLAELARLVRPGGVLVLALPDAAQPPPRSGTHHADTPHATTAQHLDDLIDEALRDRTGPAPHISSRDAHQHLVRIIHIPAS